MHFNEFIRKRGDEFPFCVSLSDTNHPDQPLLYVNEAFKRLSGYAHEEIIGRNCRFLQNGKTDPEVLKAIRGAIKNRRPLCVDLMNLKKNGEKFYNRLILIPVKDATPAFLGLQHEIPEASFQKFLYANEEELLDKTLNPLAILLMAEMNSEEMYKSQFEAFTKRIRDFILGS